MDFFDPALGDLQDAVPSGWAGARDPNGELYKWLAALAQLVDELALAVEQDYRNTSIDTADLEALLFEYAWAYGVNAEEAPLGAQALRAYIKARASEDGSPESLRRTLLAILRVPPNTGGTVLIFPADGSGLTFPADGSGIGPLYGGDLDAAGALTFPTDGSGLLFPADGSGIVFPTDPVGWLLIDEFATFFQVTTRDWLAFNRPAFLRAMTRHRPSHTLPPVLIETP